MYFHFLWLGWLNSIIHVLFYDHGSLISLKLKLVYVKNELELVGLQLSLHGYPGNRGKKVKINLFQSFSIGHTVLQATAIIDR